VGERKEVRAWLEERNFQQKYLDRHYLIGHMRYPNCGRDLVFELYVKGAKRIEVEPLSVPKSLRKEESASKLFITLPDDWKMRLELMIFIANLHNVKTNLESEGPVVIGLTL